MTDKHSTLLFTFLLSTTVTHKMAMEDTRKLSAISPESDQTVSDDSLEEVSDKANISNEFSDLLPSFEMHNFMFNRTLTDDLPPAYQESITDTVGSSTQYSESVPFSEPALNPANFVLNNLHKLQKINLPFDVRVTLTEKLPQQACLTKVETL